MMTHDSINDKDMALMELNLDEMDTVSGGLDFRHSVNGIAEVVKDVYDWFSDWF
ncbi:hypothetical protein [Butyrivibrio sp. AE2032]|uniref:hypothetical protein n=1 Tax=Butyrivibrio sp. AE2032 TaxID=1458463 RepID=UPI000A70F78F|nr:hypothetical protein [Butyrivibrio sp. AE2032]